MPKIIPLMIFLGLLLPASQAVAQQQMPRFDSLKIIPEQPTAGDELKLICYTTFSSGDCQLD